MSVFEKSSDLRRRGGVSVGVDVARVAGCLGSGGIPRTYYSHPGVVFLPVRDAPTTEWALASRKDDVPPRVRGFIDTATELGPRALGKNWNP